MPSAPRQSPAKLSPAASPRYQPLAIVLVAVSAGIVLDRNHPLSVLQWAAASLVAWLAWLGCRRKSLDRLSSLALFASLAAIGGGWHHCRWNLFAADELGLYAQEGSHPICMEAIAVGAPRRVPAPPFDPLAAIPIGDRSRLHVRALRLRQGETWRDASGDVQLLVDGRLTDVHAGDRLRVFGQLSRPTSPQNPGEMDFAQHARADRLLCRLSADFPECVQVIQRPLGENWTRWFDDLRHRADSRLWLQLDRPRSGLASALLLGMREELDRETTEAYVTTGTVHLLSISGLHVGLLAGFLFGVMRLGFIRRGAALLAVSVLIVFYAMLIDAEPPAVRATVVVLVICAALHWGRQVLPINALAAAALLVLAQNPADLFRIGPQLSFLAVATLTWLGWRQSQRPPQDPLDRLIAQTRPWPERACRRTLSAASRSFWLTAWVWAVSAPLVLAQFHLVSPVTLILTPLLAAPVAVGLVSGFLVLGLDCLWAGLGWPLAIVCKACLWLVELGAHSASQWPGGHFWAPGPAGWWLCGLYAALAWWAIGVRCPPRRWRWAILCGWITVGLLPALTRSPVQRLDCTFLSVGHGCSVLVELPGGQTLLYDAGRLGSPAAGARSISSFLWSQGKRRIDAVVLSHSDVDHYNALPELLQKFTVGGVYLTPRMLQDEGAAMRKLRSAIEAAGVPIWEIWSGDRLRGPPGCRLEVLHPTRDGVLGSDNANSLVLLVEADEREILLTGDLESPGMDDMLAEEPLDCDVILAPHHGSLRSNPPGFAAWSTPEWVIISGGHGPDRTAVEEAYRRVGAQVLNTAEVGAVQASVVGGQVWVRPLIQP